MDLEKLSFQVCEISERVAVFILSQVEKVSAKDIVEKEKNSLVSYVDETAEKMLVQELSELLPDAGYITEEKTIAQESKNLTWIIDPLDGTTNYLQQIPHYSISVALLADNEIVVGVVYDVAMKECFYAWKSGGCYSNDRKIEIAQKDDISQAIIVTGFPYNAAYDTQSYIQIFTHWIENARGIRRFGSAALDLAYVASGRLDAYYESSLNAWDLAAGILLVREAGGVATDFNGEHDSLNSGNIIACNKNLYKDIYNPIQKYLINKS
jgi:myo-inositol-1(or 4)-monophosphatase